MVFSSSTFIFAFLPLTLLLYYISPRIVKNYTLLAASLFFYWWNQNQYLYLLIESILVNYLFGIIIWKSNKRLLRLGTLTAGLTLDIALLGVYKYTDFVISIINDINEMNTPEGFMVNTIPLTDVLLPVGISFFTFQGISYLVDIYRRTCKCCYNPFETALYIASFPQLVAGPIVKYNEVSQQIKDRRTSIKGFAEGIEKFVTGLAKKTLIANTLGETTDNVFASISTGIDTPTAWLGIICYTLQIYYDFSGYSDMAVGLGRMFGFTFPENFNYPYISISITEFWRRWHISLSTWFRDYLYIPLGGNRKGFQSVNLLIVFFVTGLWHGASWNFVVWGLWYGVLLVFEKMIMLTKIDRIIPKSVRWFVTMAIVMAGWVVFRADDMGQAISYFEVLAGKDQAFHRMLHQTFKYNINGRIVWTIVAGVIFATPAFSFICGKMKKLCYKNAASTIVYDLCELAVIFILFALSIICVVNETYNPFIYFRF